MSLSLRVRLTAVYTAVFGLLIGGLSVMSYQVLAQHLDDAATVRLGELAEGLHGFVRFRNSGPTVVFDPADASQAAFVDEATDYYAIYDATTGQKLAESAGFQLLGLPSPPPNLRTATTKPEFFDISTSAGRFRVSSCIGKRPSDRAYLLQVAGSLASTDDTLSHYRALLVWRVPLALVIAALATWWFASFALAPLAQVAAKADEIDVSNLAARLPVRGVGDELDHVAQTFNQTLSRLEHAVGDMRQFSSALAHELRTPLAALRGTIELDLRRSGSDALRADALASQLEEIDRLTRLIDQILTLARAESGQIPFAPAPIDLSALGAALMEQLVPLGEARAIDLRSDVAGPLVIEADGGWIQRLILNLVDNALKFTPAGGQIVLCVRSAPQGAEIEVRDTGVGIPAADASRIFERFFRADPARSSESPGAGLGLSLVKWIVEGHHGRIRVQSKPGEGTRVIVWLPTSGSK